MGMKGKSKRANERKQKRRAEKERRKELYKSFAASGKTKNSRRATKSKVKKLGVISHPFGPCGNVGCLRCSPCAIPRRGHRAYLYQERLHVAQEKKEQAASGVALEVKVRVNRAQRRAALRILATAQAA